MNERTIALLIHALFNFQISFNVIFNLNLIQFTRVSQFSSTKAVGYRPNGGGQTYSNYIVTL